VGVDHREQVFAAGEGLFAFDLGAEAGVGGALWPMVTLMSRWPAMTWAMCGGRPLITASEIILLKSCGE